MLTLVPQTFKVSIGLLVTLSCVSAYNVSTAWEYVPPGAKCRDVNVSVTVTSLNYPWTAPTWTDDYGFIDFASLATSRTDDGFPPPIGAPVTERAAYTIGATFCTPVVPCNNSQKVLLATHGLGFDRSYWNPPYKANDYNFVQYAIQRGYSIFFYDRLGVGSSSRISGYHNQLNIQVSILASLATTLRTSTRNYTLLPSAPSSIILLGHSFGSFVSHSLIASNPSLADGVILTGYGLTGSDDRMILQGFSPRVANLQSPRFSSYDSGYVTTSDVFANINSFFKAPAYTHDMATYAENTKAPFSVMELVSLKPTLLKLNATGFKGPALVLSGEYDWIVCGGYCVGEMEPSFDGLFGAGTGFETYIQPKTGHALNFATNATGSFTAIFAYLANHGL